VGFASRFTKCCFGVPSCLAFLGGLAFPFSFDNSCLCFSLSLSYLGSRRLLHCFHLLLPGGLCLLSLGSGNLHLLVSRLLLALHLLVSFFLDSFGILLCTRSLLLARFFDLLDLRICLLLGRLNLSSTLLLRSFHLRPSRLLRLLCLLSFFFRSSLCCSSLLLSLLSLGLFLLSLGLLLTCLLFVRLCLARSSLGLLRRRLALLLTGLLRRLCCSFVGTNLALSGCSCGCVL